VTTEEQRQADEALDAAITQARQAYGLMRSGETSEAWTMVVYTSFLDGDGEQQDSYDMMHRGGGIPDHVALGLLTLAADNIRFANAYAKRE
jgi:hypothetical protein